MPPRNIATFYRIRAAHLRKQAAHAPDEASRDRLLGLAEQCDELATATKIIDLATHRQKRLQRSE
jgi:hypothetical protein